MLSEIRAKISDFFNRLPAVALIPLVLLVAFGIAAFLIWAGIEMSPVTEKMAEDLLTEKAPVPNNQNGSSSSGRPGSNIQTVPVEEDGRGERIDSQSSGAEKYNVYRAGTDKSASSSGSSSGDAGGNGSLSNIGSGMRPEPENSSNSGFKSGDLNQQENLGQGGAQPSGPSGQTKTNNNSNQNSSDNGPGGGGQDEEEEAQQEECYHPPGDVQKWWHNATSKQKECYISQHGQPNLGQQAPYFCAYNNSEDCYYR